MTHTTKPALPQATRPRAREARRRLLRGVLIALVLAPVYLLAAEAGYRGWLALRGERYDADSVRRVLERSTFHDNVSQTGQRASAESHEKVRMLHPYLGWTDPQMIAAIDEHLAYYRSEAAERNYDVMLLGGSVAWAFGLVAEPALAKLLLGEPRFAGRQIRVFSYGRPAYKQPQQTILLAWLLAIGHRPDAVISLDGYNELTLSVANAADGVHPAQPHADIWSTLARGRDTDAEGLNRLLSLRELQEGAREVALDALRLDLPRSAILGRLTESRLGRINRAAIEAQRGYVRFLSERSEGPLLRGPAFGPDLGSVMASAIGTWYQCALALHALCAAHAIDYVHVLQPNAHVAGGKTLTHEEAVRALVPPDWREALATGHPALQAAGKRLATQGVRFVDASYVFRATTTTIYQDACHIASEGYWPISELVAAQLLAAQDEVAARAKHESDARDLPPGAAQSVK